LLHLSAKETWKRNIFPKKSEETVFTKKSLKRNHCQFSFKKMEEKNLRKTIWRGSIYEEIFEEKSLPFFLKKLSTKETWKRQIFEKQSEATVFTKKSLKRNHYHVFF